MPAKELYFRNLLHCYGCIPAYSSTKKMLTKKSLIIKQKVFHLFFFFLQYFTKGKLAKNMVFLTEKFIPFTMEKHLLPYLENLLSHDWNDELYMALFVTREIKLGRNKKMYERMLWN
jgi:hypothetical protein